MLMYIRWKSTGHESVTVQDYLGPVSLVLWKVLNKLKMSAVSKVLKFKLFSIGPI